MTFEEALEKQKRHIFARLQEVYHLSEEKAGQTFQGSSFCGLMADPTTNLWQDNAEANFLRLQNEIEYGSWKRNELGEIAE